MLYAAHTVFAHMNFACKTQVLSLAVSWVLPGVTKTGIITFASAAREAHEMTLEYPPLNSGLFNLDSFLHYHFQLHMKAMKLVIPLHSLYWSIHTKDESKRGSAFAFIFGVN